MLTTVRKTYKNKDEWDQTPFLNPRLGDIRDLMDALQEFHEFEKMIKPGA